MNLNEKDIFGYYPLDLAINDNNTKIVQLLIEYANQHQIILELNEKGHEGYPLLKAISENNTKIVQLLIKYAIQHQIILELIEKNKYGKYPLLYATFNKIIVIA